MKVALVQMNPTVGAVAANAANIVQFARDAATAGAAVAIFPEMALSGYPPDDLALRPRFMDAVMAELEKLAADLPADLLVVVGTPLREGEQLFNAAALYHGGRQVGVARKIQLAKYGAFDERRIFTPGTTPLIHEFGGLRWAIQIGEDSWWPERTPQAAGLKGKCDAVLHLAASPYCRDGELERERMACSAAAAAGAPLLCVNLVGRMSLCSTVAARRWTPSGGLSRAPAFFGRGCSSRSWRRRERAGRWFRERLRSGPPRWRLCMRHWPSVCGTT